MKSYQAADARLKMRDLLDEFQRDQDAVIEILRYDKRAAIVVSPEWYERAVAALANYDSDEADDLAARYGDE